MSQGKAEQEVDRNLELEEFNFRVNSDGWVKGTDPASGQEYLVSPTGDIWELINCREHPELNGEQLFTWDAAMRETQKAGKRMPTDEEFSQFLRTKDDMPNLVLAGYRTAGGSFYLLSSFGYLWSSLQSGSYALGRYLSSSYATVYRNTFHKAFGFSVRCLKN